MKKLIALLLAMIMVLSMAAMTGCDDTDGDDTAAKGKVYYLNFKPEADQARITRFLAILMGPSCILLIQFRLLPQP